MASPIQASRGAGQALPDAFFDRDACTLARDLLGKVIRHCVDGLWLSARIIETEAYYLEEKGSHASLGYTHKRRALFMDGGVIYMYYARGGDSLNFSAAGPGNAVLIKSGYPWTDALSGPEALARMQQLNPDARGLPRPPSRLCAGQTLLCRSLGLKVPQWDARRFDPGALYVEDVGGSPQALVCTTRLGIPPGRDEHLHYRFVDPAYAAFCTRNPLRRGQRAGHDYVWVDRQGVVLPEAPEIQSPER
ncbi:3-methyladenine DNA glycosylase [Achromobacter spanius]|uniref:DNA-3-methyladenine glycosylase n=1 Tax=Achromobacter spanius TaxID=217203 RepID=UPI000C2BAFCE|nr:DNA-3-methyladenine glycosylase [Achromobacter spanius]AUA59198.1 3-methyladenine DNA glycosylase [Achromobacter spanius]CAB3700474.1 Putative 3-methyladenine DNA glycosylase [Achromobacter spanius]SPT40634.1 3-methyladenine DNA glycosylase [Achromobacter denitrificans]VEE58611.1 3-methyladenine DNA glycosylase [Achromobacter spanius]